MTHINHRLGDRRSLEEDYVLFALIEETFSPEQKEELKPGFKKALEICEKYNPVLVSTDLEGIQDSETGRVPLPEGARFRARWIRGWKGEQFLGIVKSREEFLSIENPQRFCSVVYDNKESMMRALADLKEADLGQSVVVSGIFDDLFESCRKIGIRPHTVNMSAGIWGKKDLLAEREVLEFITMCGHGFVSRYLVEHLIDRVKRREIIPDEAALEMSKQCVCNFFNPVRAVHLIERAVGSGG